MNIVIVGGNGRNTQQDRQAVNELVDKLHQKHANCLFVTTAHSDGVGKFVREKCIEKDSRGKFKYQLALINIQLFVSNLPRAEVTALYQARNPAMLEIGDIFYYFANVSRSGMMEDMIAKAVSMNRPAKIFQIGDDVTV